MKRRLQEMWLVCWIAPALLCSCRTAAQCVMPWWWWYDYPTIPHYTSCHQPHPVALKYTIFSIGCYDFTTGDPLNCHEEWRETFSTDGVLGADELLLWQGGHTHARSGDVTTTTGGIYSDLSGPVDPAAIVGDTQRRTWTGFKYLPQASGVVRISVHGYFPRNYRLVSNAVWQEDPNDPTGRSFWSEIGVGVMIPGLTELPDSTADYVVNRGNKGSHPRGQSVTSAMAAKLADLGRQYRQAFHDQDSYGRWVRRSFNDMSLPWGGVFDLNDNWDCPHVLHRLGRSADVNHAAVGDGGETVPVDQELADEKARNLGLTRFERNDQDPRKDRIHYELKR
jgi:hypothetical protein